MPTVADIVEFAEELGAKPVHIIAEKCSAVRNRNSSCYRCVEACPIENVITRESNVLAIDFDACIGCQACTAVCPTEALVPLDPLDADLAAAFVASAQAAGGRECTCACARICASGRIDTRRVAEVPCLCRVDESVLLGLFSRGVRKVTLLDGVCATCKHRGTRPATQALLDSTRAVLEAWGSGCEVEWTSEPPASVLLEDEKGLLGSSRRSFFTGAGRNVKDATVKTAKKQFKLDAEKPTLREMLMVGSGKMPQFEAVRRANALDALDRIGEPIAEELECRLWGRVEIDADICNACGMCPVFCPTGALRKADAKETPGADPSADLVLEFDCNACVACDLCADACFKKCLTVSRTVRTDELMSFEPRVFSLTRGEGGGINPLFGK